MPTPGLSGGGHPAVPRHLPSPGATRRPRRRPGAGWPGRRRTAADREGRRAVQGRLRLPAAPVVLHLGQAVLPRADHLRGLRPGLPALGHRLVAGVRPWRGSGPGPGRPGRRPARPLAPPGAGEACYAGIGQPTGQGRGRHQTRRGRRAGIWRAAGRGWPVRLTGCRRSSERAGHATAPATTRTT
jgi:hypothetical protein